MRPCDVWVVVAESSSGKLGANYTMPKAVFDKESDANDYIKGISQYATGYTLFSVPYSVNSMYYGTPASPKNDSDWGGYEP
jgi:hypothetical protein